MLAPAPRSSDTQSTAAVAVGFDEELIMDLAYYRRRSAPHGLKPWQSDVLRPHKLDAGSGADRNADQPAGNGTRLPMDDAEAAPAAVQATCVAARSRPRGGRHRVLASPDRLVAEPGPVADSGGESGLESAPRLRARWSGVELRPDGTAAVVDRQGRWSEARILGSSFVSPALTILNLTVAGARLPRSLVVAPDALPAAEFRRLRVWLRWRAARAEVARADNQADT